MKRGELARGTVVAQRYVVEDLLGAGGMAVVYRVRHKALGTPMALKLLTVGQSSVRARLVKEGRVQAALRHPNIVAVVDQVDVGDAVGLVMEYVRGPTLAALAAEMRLDWNQIDDIARGLFDGIEAAHTTGIVHRDLKPANVLIELAPGRLIPKIADFGLVKILGDEEGEARGQTRTGTTFGTPEYMAPEQISDAKGVDPRADVFSVGVMLFELVTGKKPFEHQDLLELFNRIARGERARVDALRRDVPVRMVRAIDAALVPDRALRAQTIGAVRALWTEGVPSPPPAPWSDQAIEQIKRLGKGEEGVETLRRSFQGAESEVPAPTAVTAPPIEAGVTPSVLAVEDGPRRRRVAAGIGALLVVSAGLVLAALVVLGWAGAAWWRTRTPAPVAIGVPAPLPGSVAPAGVEAAPVPELPAPPLPAPPAPTAPVAVPAPVAIAGPAPVPAPAAAPVPAPPVPEPVVASVVPAPVEVPPPPVAAPARIRRDAGTALTVELQDDGGRPVPLGEVTPGTYRVFAFFQPGVPTEVGAPTLAPGSRWLVRCDAARLKCSLSQE